MKTYEQLYRGLLDRILTGQGFSTAEQRAAAFNQQGLPQPLGPLIDKVARHAYQVTDQDIEAVKASGISEDQLFELIICGATGQAARQYENGLAALSAALATGGPHAA